MFGVLTFGAVERMGVLPQPCDSLMKDLAEAAALAEARLNDLLQPAAPLVLRWIWLCSRLHKGGSGASASADVLSAQERGYER